MQMGVGIITAETAIMSKVYTGMKVYSMFTFCTVSDLLDKYL